jgi:hypothetical protein
VQAVGVTGPFLNEEFPIAGEVAKLADRRGRDETGPNETALEELVDPGGVVDVRLAAGTWAIWVALARIQATVSLRT